MQEKCEMSFDARRAAGGYYPFTVLTQFTLPGDHRFQFEVASRRDRFLYDTQQGSASVCVYLTSV